MGKYFDFQGEEEEEYRVKFEVLEEPGTIRPYGIRAEIFQSGILRDRTEARNRFLTRKEAEETVTMLCRFQVTPCTLCDVI